MQDLRRAVARPFQIEGTDSLEREDCKKILSLKLNWFEPSEAEKLVDRALERGLLEETEEGLSTTFDVSGTEVPMEFVPAVDLDAENLVDQIISEVSLELDEPRDNVVAGANGVQHELGESLSMEAAVLVYALKKGLRLPELAEEAAAQLRKS